VGGALLPWVLPVKGRRRSTGGRWRREQGRLAVATGVARRRLRWRGRVAAAVAGGGVPWPVEGDATGTLARDRMRRKTNGFATPVESRANAAGAPQ
jgi:hypothetical protein